MRGVQGLHGGLWKIIFSCFAMKALLNVTEETHSNGGGFGWIIQHLQSISVPTSSRHLSGPQGLQAHHGNVDNSQCDALSSPAATWEAMGAWISVRVCNFVYLIIPETVKLLLSCCMCTLKFKIKTHFNYINHIHAWLKHNSLLFLQSWPVHKYIYII